MTSSKHTLIAILTVIALLFGLCACGQASDEQSPANDTRPTVTTEPEESVLTRPIGRITDHKSFEREMSARLDLTLYAMEEKVWSDTQTDYVYTLKTPQALADNKTNHEAVILGKTYTLPITVEEFMMADDWSIIDISGAAVSNVPMSRTCYGDGVTFRHASGAELMTYVLPPDGEQSAALGDCLIQQLTLYYRSDNAVMDDDRSPRTDVSLFGGLNGLSTLDEIIQTLGAPEKITHSVCVYNGQPTLSTIQFCYDFPHGAYTDSNVWFTVDSVLDTESSRTDTLSSISYYIR